MKGYGSSKLTAVVILGVTIFFWQSAQADTTLLSGSFNAAEAEYHLGSFTFQATVDGQLLINMDNPDGSADGEIVFTNVTTGLRYNDGLFYGTTDYPLFNPQTWPRVRITQGRIHSLYVLPVLAGWGSCDYDVSYVSRRGTQNTGTNSITITYIPRALTQAGAELLVSLTSDPFESNSESATFDAGKGGWLLLDLLQSGTGGGNHSVYLNGRGIEYNQVGHPPRVMGVHTAVEVGAGTHDLMIRHEDNAWGDNTGVRRTDVYFIPYPFVTYYVDADAKGANDGSSWADAYNYLQNALTVALYGDEIRVAQGIYKPTDYFLPPPPPPPMGSSNDQGPIASAADRTDTFQLINGVVIKGGYVGFGEPDPNVRDIKMYVTILSGDLLENDGPDFANNGENSYHVVTGSGTNATAVLDGFTITAGNANGDSPHNNGGGMYNYDNSSPTVTNCTFKGNSADWTGGGMVNDNSSPTVKNCTFIGNSAERYGGGMFNGESSPTLTNCTFNGNSAWYGGGMYNYDNSSPTVTNCTFNGNSVKWTGGGMANDNSSPTVKNCTFIGNSAENGGGMDNFLNSSPTVTNCTLIGNSAVDGGGMYQVRNSNSTVTNCTFSGNLASESGGGMYNRSSSSPTLTNCILWGNVAPSGPQIYNYDETSSATVTYSDVQGGWPGEGNIDADPCFVQPGYFSPIAYWKLDEAGGTTAYDSVGQNHGTVYGAQWTTGQVGGALSFDGSGDLVRVPDDASLNITGDITISAWVYFTQGGSYQAIVTKCVYNGPTNNPFDFRTDASSELLTLVRAGAGGHERVYSNKHLSLNQWYHVLVKVDNKVPDFYVDGIVTGKWADTTFTKTPTGNTKPLLIGARDDGLHFHGIIDEVAIYNRALSDEEILQLYESGGYRLLPVSPCINAGDPDYPSEPNETDLDGKPRVIGGRIDMGAYEFNHRPVADAGPDRNIEAQAPWGAVVTLDGSGSSDADCTPGTFDDINDFNWYLLDPCDPNADVLLGTGRIIDCNLSIGEHIIFLEVIDRAGESDTNEVTILVQDTTPPTITCPDGERMVAYNDCVYRSGDQYIANNVTTYGIGSGFAGSTSGPLVDQVTGDDMDIMITFTESGGVNWLPDPATGGSDCAIGTDAYNTFGGIADMTGVIYYGSAGWWVDLTFTGLDPTTEYTFATSAARNNYSDRLTIYTLTGADTYTNASTIGVDVLAENKVRFNTGDNHNEGYVARWTGITATDGSFTVRAEADPCSTDGRKAYSFDVFMLEGVLSGDVTLECPADTTPSATDKATATDTCGTVTITHSDQWQPNCGNAGTLSRTWTATDESGNSSTCVQIITVVDTTPPDINCPADVTLEYPADTSPSATGKATAADTCGDVTVRCRNRIIPGCGNTEIIERTWIAADECGNESSCVQVITVVDTTPPQFELSVSPTMLWPPNHKMVEITPSWTVSDECDPSPDVSLVSIVANEGDDIIGDGHTSNDIQIDDDGFIFVRSERSGTDTGRIYTITYQAVDDCGNVTVRSATVSIPHDFKVLARIASRWLWSGPAGRIPEDLNGDGVVNLADFAKFAGNWTR